MRRRTLIPHIKKENRKIDKFLTDLFKLYKKYDFCIAHKNMKDPFIITNWSKRDEELMRDAIDGTKVEIPKPEDKKDENRKNRNINKTDS